eukprot:1879588-Prymnesium_polylepis.2
MPGRGPDPLHPVYCVAANPCSLRRQRFRERDHDLCSRNKFSCCVLDRLRVPDVVIQRAEPHHSRPVATRG